MLSLILSYTDRGENFSILGQTNSFLCVFTWVVGNLLLGFDQERRLMWLVSLVCLLVRWNTDQGIYSFLGEKCLIAWSQFSRHFGFHIWRQKWDLALVSSIRETIALPGFIFGSAGFSRHWFLVLLASSCVCVSVISIISHNVNKKPLAAEK